MCVCVLILRTEFGERGRDGVRRMDQTVMSQYVCQEIIKKERQRAMGERGGLKRRNGWTGGDEQHIGRFILSSG